MAESERNNEVAERSEAEESDSNDAAVKLLVSLLAGSRDRRSRPGGTRGTGGPPSEQR